MLILLHQEELRPQLSSFAIPDNEVKHMTQEMISIRQDPVPIYGKADVVVVGGGVAGVSAAIAAARNGKKVTLVEKGCILGGLATLGHVCVYLPLDDGVGNKVFGGLAEELLHVCIKRSYNTLAPEWKRGVMRVEKPSARYRTHFNSPAAVFSLDEIMEQEGVTVIYDAVFSQPIMDGSRCRGIVLETKQGRVALMAGMVVDASGDADVFYRAGAACEEQKSIVSHWCYELRPDVMRAGLESGKIINTLRMRWLGLRPDVDNSNSELSHFYGTTIEGVNGYLNVSRKLARDYLDQNDAPDYAMISMPYMAQFRMTRRILGLTELDMNTADQFRDDSVGCVCSALACPAPVYELPYGALLDPKLENIAAAGRIIAAGGAGWEMMRLIPACVFTGQAAGTAAALALEQGVALQEVNLPALQARLAETGVLIHIPEYMKGNKNRNTTDNPKYMADPLIKADALSYH